MALKKEQIVQLPVNRIRPNRFQPRTYFNQQRMEELAASIKAHGLRQPISVRELLEEPGEYELIFGERRWRSFKTLGLARIPSLIDNVTDEQAEDLALIENLQSESLTIMEEAHALDRMLSRNKNNNQKVADSVGKSVSFVVGRIRLLKLPDALHPFMNNKSLALWKATEILKLPREHQIPMAHRAMELKLTPSEIKGRAQQLMHPKSNGRERHSANNGVKNTRHMAAFLAQTHTKISNFDFSSLRESKDKERLLNQVGLFIKTLRKAQQILDGEMPTKKGV